MTNQEIHNLCGLYGFIAREATKRFPSDTEYYGSWNVSHSSRPDRNIWNWTFTSELEYYVAQFEAFLKRPWLSDREV